MRRNGHKFGHSRRESARICWNEYLVPNPGAVGSNPAGGAITA